VERERAHSLLHQRLTAALARAVRVQETNRAAANAHAALMQALGTTLAENRATRARAHNVRNRTRR
jgi:hypothetical protein